MGEKSSDEPSSSEGDDDETSKQISPRIPERLRDTLEACIRLDNEGTYKGQQGTWVTEAIRLKIALWVLRHPYELHRASDVDYIDDPEQFVEVALDCLRDSIGPMEEVLTQVRELSGHDADDIDKRTVTMLPQTSVEDEREVLDRNIPTEQASYEALVEIVEDLIALSPEELQKRGKLDTKKSTDTDTPLSEADLPSQDTDDSSDDGGSTKATPDH